MTIEENGPARAVVRADGTLERPDGTDVVDFTCRITARAKSSSLEVTFTVRNENGRKVPLRMSSTLTTDVERGPKGERKKLTYVDGANAGAGPAR